jgi:hypothetical protein
MCLLCGHVMGRGEWQAYDLATGRSLGHLACWGKPLGIKGVDGDIWPCECVTGKVSPPGIKQVVAFFHRPCRTRRTCAISRAVEAGRIEDLVKRELVALREPIFDGAGIDGQPRRQLP